MLLEDASGQLVGVEVKAGATLSRGDGNGLRAIRDTVGERLRRGIVLYGGDRSVAIGPDFWAIPLAALWPDAHGPDHVGRTLTS